MPEEEENLDEEGAIERLNRALALQYRSVLQYTLSSGSLFGFEFQGLSNQLASFDVNVTNVGERTVSIYKAGQAWSSVCAPMCEYTISTGEDQEWFKVLNEQHTSKASQSAGALKLGE